jgi:hypothetical protein
MSSSISRISSYQPTAIPQPINYKNVPELSSYKHQTDGYQPQPIHPTYQQGYIVPPGRSPSALSNNEAGNNNSSSSPSQIVYRGHKMVALSLLEEKDREMKSLEQANKNLSTKVSPKVQSPS